MLDQRLKVFAILFKANIMKDPNKPEIALHLGVGMTSTEVMHKGLIDIIAKKGDLIWTPVILQAVDLPSVPTDKTDKTVKEGDSNFVLKCIVNNSDDVLFDSMKQYLSDAEVKYVETRLSAIK
ncbi:MAG: hypothetical protein KAU20_07570 [Nanoarchaeota archaeon]|nr:hypothetical protein [Nanoarchaeota archaeon]